MYDPLVNPETPTKQPLPDSYWQANTQKQYQFNQLKQNLYTDVLIIGAGFTGLSCARYLKHYSLLKSLVIDANQPGWGCSGRNAGFILPGSGRMDYASYEKQFGDDFADCTIAEYYDALDTIQDMMDYANSDCDITTGGYLKIGHSKKAFKQLEAALRKLPEPWKSQYKVVSADEISSQFIDGYPSHGGIYRATGQGINPLKFAMSLAKKISYQQENLYGNTPVQQIIKVGSEYRVITPEAEIQCGKIVLTSNAYSLNSLLPGITEKQFPVLSSVLVTSPLSEQQASGWQRNLMAMDTRSLKYYFRILPDNRILFGGRGAVAGKDANTQQSQAQLKQAFDQYFPNLNQADIEYFWSGWVSVSADNMPHVLHSQKHPNVYYANGYCGSGLAFSCQAGKRLAQMVGDSHEVPFSPIYQFDIPAFPFAKLRRLGLNAYYAWHRAFD